MQEWVKATRRQDLHRLRGPRHGRQGRHDQGDHRARQPARVPRRRAARADRARESQMYIQRYIPHFPAAGEVVIFDRSWYNRAGVERVMGFCTDGADGALPRAGPGRRAGDGRLRDPAASSTGSRSARTSRPGGCRAGSTIRARSGSCPAWTSSPTAAGTTTRGPATRCSPRPTPRGRPGSSRTRTTRSAGGSTSSPTCSSQVPYSRSSTGTSSCRSGRSRGDYVEPDLPLRHIPTPF